MNTNTNTININDAIAQANRNTRALQILEAGYKFTQRSKRFHCRLQTR